LILSQYFQLSAEQERQFEAAVGLYQEWNTRINVLSRKDIQQIESHHILHSLAIAKVEAFVPGSRVLDVGTGGGFPGIPLAILFPQVEFTLTDSIGKKIKVVEAISSSLGLSNVTAVNQRAEEVKGRFDFVVSRAVTRLDVIWPWISSKFSPVSTGNIKNGLLCLKGGDISAELEALDRPAVTVPVSTFFREKYFEMKLIVHVPS